MLFRRFRKREHESLGSLTAWALGQRGPAAELERLYGPEHAEELGPMAWLFRAVEAAPVEEPSLGRWQRWESELRARLTLLPPPRHGFATLLPPLLLLPVAQPAAVKAAVGDIFWKSATVAAATTALTAQVITSGALRHLEAEMSRSASPPAVEVCADFEPTGNALMDRVQLNALALQPGDVNLTALDRAARSIRRLSG
jgi:hypothetical protein